jgi:hypothetical protein
VRSWVFLHCMFMVTSSAASHVDGAMLQNDFNPRDLRYICNS